MRRRSDAPRVRVSDLQVDEELALTLPGWSPGSSTSTARWTSWTDYLSTYGKVRAELLFRMAARSDDAEPWAELVYRYRDEHGVEALEVASYDDIEATL